MHPVPTTLAVALAAVFVLAGCHESTPIPGDGDDGSSTVETRDLAHGQNSGHEEEAHRVIDSQDEWETFWVKHEEKTTEKSDPPEVDFSSERVVAVSLGERPNGCYAVAITDVRFDAQDDETQVDVTEKTPADDEVCTDQIVHPYHFIAIPDDGSQVVFVEQESAGSSSGGDGTDDPQENGGTQLETRDLAQGQHSGHDQEERRVIESQEEWEAFWEKHEENQTNKSDPPEVDFSSQRVVAVLLGQRPNGCYAVTISDVVSDLQAGETRVNVTEKVPAPDAICPQVIVHPFHFVAVPADGTDVVFSEDNE